MAYLPVVSRVTVDQTFLADLYFRLGTVNADLSLLNPTPFSPLNFHSPTIRFLRDIFDRAKNAFVVSSNFRVEKFINLSTITLEKDSLSNRIGKT